MVNTVTISNAIKANIADKIIIGDQQGMVCFFSALQAKEKYSTMVALGKWFIVLDWQEGNITRPVTSAEANTDYQKLSIWILKICKHDDFEDYRQTIQNAKEISRKIQSRMIKLRQADIKNFYFLDDVSYLVEEEGEFDNSAGISLEYTFKKAANLVENVNDWLA